MLLPSAVAIGMRSFIKAYRVQLTNPIGEALFMDINDLRNEIDKIDKEIVALFEGVWPFQRI